MALPGDGAPDGSGGKAYKPVPKVATPEASPEERPAPAAHLDAGAVGHASRWGNDAACETLGECSAGGVAAAAPPAGAGAPPPAGPDPTDVALALHEALVIGSNVDAATQALSEVPPAERRAVVDAYASLQRDLPEDLELADDSAREAFLGLLWTSLTPAERVRTASSGVNADEQGMLDALSSPTLTPASRDAAAADPKLKASLDASLSPAERFQAEKSLATGAAREADDSPENSLYAAVVRRIEACQGKWLPTSVDDLWNLGNRSTLLLNDDEQSIYDAILDLPVPLRQRLYIDEQALLASIFDTAELANVAALCGPSEGAALAMRMKLATAGAGTDDEGAEVAMARAVAAFAERDKLLAEVRPLDAALADPTLDEDAREALELQRGTIQARLGELADLDGLAAAGSAFLADYIGDVGGSLEETGARLQPAAPEPRVASSLSDMRDTLDTAEAPGEPCNDCHTGPGLDPGVAAREDAAVASLRREVTGLPPEDRAILRRGYALARGLAELAPGAEAQDAEARELFQRIDGFLVAQLSGEERAVVLETALGPPTAAEIGSPSGRLLAAKILARQVGERQATPGPADALMSADDTARQARAEFAGVYESLLADGEVSDSELLLLGALSGRHATAEISHHEDLDAAGEAAATAAGIAVGIAVCMLAPASAPLLAIMLGAAGLGAVGAVFAGQAAEGDALEGPEAAQLALVGAVNAATGPIADHLLAVRFAGGLGPARIGQEAVTAGKLAGAAARTGKLGTIGQGAATGLVEGVLGTTLLEAAQRDTWNRGVWDGLCRVVASAAQAGALGAVSGGLVGGAIASGQRVWRRAEFAEAFERAVRDRGIEPPTYRLEVLPADEFVARHPSVEGTEDGLVVLARDGELVVVCRADADPVATMSHELDHWEQMLRGGSRGHGSTGKRTPTAIMPNGTEHAPTSMRTNGFYGTDDPAVTPDIVFEKGLPERGPNRSLLDHARGEKGDSAFRGTTPFIISPDGEAGAGLWGDWVYEIDDVPGWEVNQLLEGRREVAGGIGGFGGNQMSGEIETAIDGLVLPQRIKGAYPMMVGRGGRRAPGKFLANPNYLPLESQ